MEEYEIIELEDENGNLIPFEVIDTIPVNGTNYIVVLPEEEGEEDSIEILRVEPVDAEFDDYIPETDEEVIDAVYAAFKERHADEFDFAD